MKRATCFLLALVLCLGLLPASVFAAEQPMVTIGPETTKVPWPEEIWKNQQLFDRWDGSDGADYYGGQTLSAPLTERVTLTAVYAGEIAIDEHHFPDPVLREQVKSGNYFDPNNQFDPNNPDARYPVINGDGDGFLSWQEAQPVQRLDLEPEIRDLRGIAYFQNIDLVDLASIPMPAVELAELPNLKKVFLYLGNLKNGGDSLQLPQNLQEASLLPDHLSSLSGLQLKEKLQGLQKLFLHPLHGVDSQLTAIAKGDLPISLETLTMRDLDKLVGLDLTEQENLSELSIGSTMHLAWLNLAPNAPLSRLKLDAPENTVLLPNGYELPDDFHPERAQGIQGGTVTDGVLHFAEGSNQITYIYETGKEDVTLPVIIEKQVDPSVDETNFPDPEFRRYIREKVDTDQNDILSYDEIRRFKVLSLPREHGYLIQNLQGVKYFTALKHVYLDYGMLPCLDLSGQLNSLEIARYESNSVLLEDGALLPADFDPDMVTDLLADGEPGTDKNQVFVKKNGRYTVNFGTAERISYAYDPFAGKAPELVSPDVQQYLTVTITKSTEAREQTVEISKANFPDPAFRRYIEETYDLDKDGKLTSLERACASIYFDSTWREDFGYLKEVSSVQGAEYFSTVRMITIKYTRLEEVDLSSFPDLRELKFTGNRIVNLDLSKNPLLPAYKTRLNLSRTMHDGEALPRSFDPAMVSELKNGEIRGEKGACTIHFTGSEPITYVYDVQNQNVENPLVTITRGYTVTFVDHDGTVLQTYELVEAGTAVQAPQDPVREGYTFLGWDKDFDRVTGDLTITAQYEKPHVPSKPVAPKPVDPKPEKEPLPFRDVAEDQWYYEPVAYVREKNLMQGTAPDRFEPDTTTDRAMLVTILYRLEQEPQAGDAAFSDVASDAYYAEAVAWAAKQGIVTGVSDTEFAPRAALTREQLAVMLWRYAGEPEPKTKNLSFADADQVHDYASDALCWAVEEGILNGMGDNLLIPQGTATRAQVAAMLMRYLER